MKSARPKSTARKPLADISNGYKPPEALEKPPPPPPPPLPEAPEKQPPPAACSDDGAVDRLLLARSDLSNLFNQIDELVAQAVQLKMLNRTGSQDIESFSHVLSDMHSTLKPWVSRFQEAFGGALLASEEQSAPCTDIVSLTRANEEGNAVNSTSDEDKTDLTVSPSPLVSWPAGACKVQSGRQLFLLTPVPKSKILSSRFPGASKSTAGLRTYKDTPHNILRNPPLSIPRNSCTELMKKAEFKMAPSHASRPCTTEAKNSESEGGGPSLPGYEKSKSMKKSTCLPTPCLKILPLKSCVLANETPQNKYGGIPKPSQVSEYLDIEEVSAGLAERHGELLGLRSDVNLRSREQELDEDLDWFLSPPKTCILMEPSDEKPLPTPAVCGLPATPMLNDFQSTVQRGKRAGESTLKRELWVKFDAVSTASFDNTVFRKSERKGFLDMLEEASCEVDEDSSIGR